MEVHTNVFEFVAAHVFEGEEVDCFMCVDGGAYVIDYGIFVISCFFRGLG